MRHLVVGPATALIGLAAALTCVAALAIPSMASARARTSRSPACGSRHAGILKTTQRVKVWKKRTGTDPYSGGSLDTLYACLRPHGRSVVIGQTAGDGPEYVGNVATSQLAITKTTVSDLLTTGLASQQACFKYDPTSPQCATAATETAQVFNLSRHRTLRQPLAGAPVAYAFSSDGAIAWESPVDPGTSGSPLELQAVGFDPSSLEKGAVQTLDTGDLGTALEFTGLVLHWTKAGQPVSQLVSSTG